MTAPAPVKPAAPTAPSIATRAGNRPSLGVNRWGQQQVACPNCGGPATVDAAGDIWCWACNFTSGGAAGCT